MDLSNFSLVGNEEDEARNDIQQPLQGGSIQKNIYYRDSKDPEYCDFHTLDILVPEGIDDTQKLPVVIHVHGGGWQRGSKDIQFYGAPFMGQQYVKYAFVTILINYRKTRHPKAAEDVAFALKWVVDNVAKYSGDKAKIFLSGHSAGAHLISLIATDHNYLASHNLTPSIIKGCIALSGIYNVGSPLSDDENDWKNILYRKFYVEKTFGLAIEDWVKASPFDHVTNHADHSTIPPFVICNAGFDFGLEVDGGKFHNLLVSKGVTSKHHIIQCTNHQSISTREDVVSFCLEFIYDTLSQEYS